ncbi:MAG TPA: NAD(P)-binding domain-containing protein [Pyrinomonadaceae bacterium]|nr:NAD(P)-binding domain-containing protein [Pyrinomonadaceae bacterium]
MSSAASGDPVIIIGAGPAGLAVAHTLAKRRIDYVLLEKGSSVASALREVDPEMRLLSPASLSLMPDMKIDANAPTYLPFKTLVHELERYQQQHGLKAIFNSTVVAVRLERVGFSVRYRTSDGAEVSMHGSHVINATGIISKPKLPENFKPGAMTIPWMHSLDARTEHLAKSRRLLVVGGGASAAEVLENWLKVRQKNDRAWLSLRSRLFAVPHWIFGIDVHYFAWLPEQLPAWLFGPRVSKFTEPMTGGIVVRAIRNGLIQRMPYVRRYQNGTVEFANRQHIQPDLIVFATGFTYSFEHLEGLVDLDPYGRPIVRNCESTHTKGLFLMGFRYGRTFASPYLRGIARDAEYVAEEIARRKRSK